MAVKKRLYHLNLRQKILLSLAFYFLALFAVGLLSFEDLRLVEKRQIIVQITADLSNTILEMRRFEKNYLLYHKDEDLSENASYIAKAKETLQALAQEITSLRGAGRVTDMGDRLSRYEDIMERIGKSAPDADHSDANPLIVELRATGKDLLDETQSLVARQRRGISETLGTLETQLALSVLGAVAVGLLLPMVTFRRVLRPLRMLKDATERIARGQFEELPVPETGDEVEQLMEAFNRMVREVDKRQDQLVQARKLSSLGTLAAGIAHQLNNPLNNISTSCQIALEEWGQQDPTYSRKLLTNIEQETLRARDIVKGLLEFSREQEFSPRPAPLAEVMEKTIRLVSSQVPSGIVIVTNIPEDLILALDVQRIQEAFLNLIINAVDALPARQGRIEISAEVDETGQNALLTVADNGAGIPKAVVPYIFDPFYTTKEEGAGTGLGLSIVYGIIEKHQGAIRVESEPDRGTRFILTLPLAGTTQALPDIRHGSEDMT